MFLLDFFKILFELQAVDFFCTNPYPLLKEFYFRFVILRVDKLRNFSEIYFSSTLPLSESVVHALENLDFFFVVLGFAAVRILSSLKFAKVLVSSNVLSCRELVT